jgi:acyl dehydratase
MDIETPLIRAGEEIRAQIRDSREQITQFAHLTGDMNPLHHDRQAAERASFGEIIASGQQTAAQMMGVASSHFSRGDDGLAREVLCLECQFAFPAPVFAATEVQIEWRVVAIERNTSRGGFVGRLEGEARVGGRVCVSGRAALLVRRAASRLSH